MQHAIVVLNGANGAAIEVKPLARVLAPFGRTYTPDLLGHGGRPIPEQLSMQAVAEDLIAYLDYQKIPRAIFVGFSLGGLVGLYLARHYPDRVVGVCGIATKFVFDEATVARWEYLGDPDRIGRPGNPRANELAQAHFPEDWAKVSRANNRWYRELGLNPPLNEADFAAINVPVKLYSGTSDPIVTVDEQKKLARLLHTNVGLFPGAAHPLTKAPLTDLAREIGQWIAKLPAASQPVTH